MTKKRIDKQLFNQPNERQRSISIAIGNSVNTVIKKYTAILPKANISTYQSMFHKILSNVFATAHIELLQFR